MKNIVDIHQNRGLNLDKINKCPFTRLEDCSQYLIGIGLNCNNLREDKLCGVLSRAAAPLFCTNNVQCSGTLTLIKKDNE